MTLLPESLKSRTSSNWDFHLITDFKLIIIPAMLFFTVLGLTKAPQKLKKYRIGKGSNLNLLLIAICRQAHPLNLNRIDKNIIRSGAS